MKTAERIDTLIDLSLNGEASDNEMNELQELVSSSDELMEYYFESIDQQLTLKQHFEDSPPISKNVETSRPKKFPYWLIISIAIAFTVLILLNNKNSHVGFNGKLTVTKESHGVSILRNNSDINTTVGQELLINDLVEVSRNGELWLQSDEGLTLYLHPQSELRMEKKSKEIFQLLKGSLCGDIAKPSFVFITRDVEIKTEKAVFKTTIKDGKTILSVKSGKVKMTRLKDGEFIEVQEGQSADSSNLSANVILPEDKEIFPALENGVNYYYYALDNNGLPKETEMFDIGVTDRIDIVRGDHEGYVHHRPDSHSDVFSKPFHIFLQTLYKNTEDRPVYFRLTGRKKSTLSINGKSVQTSEDFQAVNLKTDLKKGLYPLIVETPGIIEDDHPDYALKVEVSFDGKTFDTIPGQSLFFRNPHPLPDQFTEDNIDRSLSARLPLKGNYKDTINNQEAAPVGTPQFIVDKEFGLVCELDGKKDYLVHLPVDQMGMARNYTATAWVKLYEGGHYDQPIFANTSGGYNATLVLLIRRRHPYLAHLHNDTVAAERLEFGKWAHVVFRYHNGEQAIFLDGKLCVNSFHHSSLFSNSPLLIGLWGNNRLLKGLLREIRIYNTALSPSDIKLLYEKTSKKKSGNP